MSDDLGTSLGGERHRSPRPRDVSISARRNDTSRIEKEAGYKTVDSFANYIAMISSVRTQRVLFVIVVLFGSFDFLYDTTIHSLLLCVSYLLHTDASGRKI
jgi:hypothetical protein